MTPHAQQMIDGGLDNAKEALEKADAAELYSLYLNLGAEYRKLFGMFDTLVAHYAGTTKEPRFQPPSDTVSAMRDVAIAAIQLASNALPGDPKS